MEYRIKTRTKLGFALILAAFGAVLLWLYAEQLDDEHEALVADQVEVVKAAHDIPAGTPLTKDHITTQKVPRKFLPPNPLLESELNIYLGTPVAVNIDEREMILTSDFSHRQAAPTTTVGSTGSDEDGRLLVKTASLQMQSETPAAVAAKLASTASAAGGFVAKSSARSLDGEAFVELTVRVPADRFDEILNQYRASATGLSETVEGVDVTDKFENLELQARNQRALETKLLTFVEEAKTVDDAIKLEEKIQKYRMEAEKLERRARRLHAQSPLSTIHITLSTPRVQLELPPEPGIFAPLTNAFDDAGTIVLELAAMLIRFFAALVPFVIVFGPILIAVAALRRRQRSAS